VTDSRPPDTEQPPGAPGAPEPPSVAARMTGAAGGSDPRGEVAGGGWRIALLVAAGVAFGLYAGKGWVVTLVVITVMIFLHELGHYLTAKWSGMKVTEFFLFFGPKLWSFRRGETEYGIKLIPVGAYVRIIGMNNLDECAPEDEPRTFRQQSFPKRLLVISAGSLMHFIQAFVLFLVAFSWLGVPAYTEEAQRLGGPIDETSWVIGSVTEGSGAEAAGLKPGDDLVTIDGHAVERFDDVGPLIADHAGDRVRLGVERDGAPLQLTATIGHRRDDPSAGFLGIGGSYPDLPPVTGNPVRAVVVAGELTASTIKNTVVSMAGFFTGGMGDFASTVADGGNDPGPAVSGPDAGGGRPVNDRDEHRLVSILGVARIGASLSEEGMSPFLLLFAFVNVAIGVLNLLPLLPLDGGHAAVAIYERIRSIGGRRHMADVSRLLPLTYAVFLFLVLLGASSIYLDLVDPIGLG
jgi:membrane-associated protease RseP (regulator of RpoE activity)